MLVRLLFAILVLLGAACEPVLVIPGGRLGGTPGEAPSDWSFTDDVQTVQLETRPEAPYSVNIWAVGLGDRIYVHAGANRSTWVEHMEAEPVVRLRVNQTLYSLRASRVREQAEFDRFSAAYERKYGRRPRNENVEEAYLFRLDSH